MKASSTITSEIMHTILDIEKQFPELTKYLDELPNNFSYDESREVSDKNLADYHKTLKDFLCSYGKCSPKPLP